MLLATIELNGWLGNTGDQSTRRLNSTDVHNDATEWKNARKEFVHKHIFIMQHVFPHQCVCDFIFLFSSDKKKPTTDTMHYIAFQFPDNVPTVPILFGAPDSIGDTLSKRDFTFVSFVTYFSKQTNTIFINAILLNWYSNDMNDSSSIFRFLVWMWQ